MMTKKINKRAIRRHHRTRLIQKRLKNSYFRDLEDIEMKNLKKAINTPKQCSCFMCGNPRKHFKEKTKQELIGDLKCNYDINILHDEES